MGFRFKEGYNSKFFFFRITNIGVKNGVKPEYHQTMSVSRLFWFLCFMLSVSLRFLQVKPKIVLPCNWDSYF